MRETGDPGLAGKRGNYGGVGADLRFFYEAAGEGGAQDSFVDKILMERELAFGVQDGHLGARVEIPISLCQEGGVNLRQCTITRL